MSEIKGLLGSNNVRIKYKEKNGKRKRREERKGNEEADKKIDLVPTEENGRCDR